MSVVRYDNYPGRMRYRKLFLRDLLRRLAEHLGVLERDVREQHDLGVDDVGRIESPPEPGLDDGDVDPLLGELRKRRRRQRLELHRADRFGVRTDASDGTFEICFCPIDPDALRPA